VKGLPVGLEAKFTVFPIIGLWYCCPQPCRLWYCDI